MHTQEYDVDTINELYADNAELVKALSNAESSFLSLAPFLPNPDDRFFAESCANHCREAAALTKARKS